MDVHWWVVRCQWCHKSNQIKKHMCGPEPHVPHACGDITKEPLEDVGSPKSGDFHVDDSLENPKSAMPKARKNLGKVRVRVAWPTAGGQNVLWFWWRITTMPFPCSCFFACRFHVGARRAQKTSRVHFRSIRITFPLLCGTCSYHTYRRSRTCSNPKIVVLLDFRQAGNGGTQGTFGKFRWGTVVHCTRSCGPAFGGAHQQAGCMRTRMRTGPPARRAGGRWAAAQWRIVTLLVAQAEGRRAQQLGERAVRWGDGGR